MKSISLIMKLLPLPHGLISRAHPLVDAPAVPQALVDQLTDEGVLITPVGGEAEQTIVRVVREGRRSRETPMLAFRFVKLIGHAGWADNE